MSNDGHNVEAIDISDGMLEVARSNVNELGNPEKVREQKEALLSNDNSKPL